MAQNWRTNGVDKGGLTGETYWRNYIRAESSLVWKHAIEAGKNEHDAKCWSCGDLVKAWAGATRVITIEPGGREYDPAWVKPDGTLEVTQVTHPSEECRKLWIISGWVYVLTGFSNTTNLTKIGYTGDMHPGDRIRAAARQYTEEGARPLAWAYYTRHAGLMEKHVHHSLREHRIGNTEIFKAPIGYILKTTRNTCSSLPQRVIIWRKPQAQA